MQVYKSYINALRVQIVQTFRDVSAVVTVDFFFSLSLSNEVLRRVTGDGEFRPTE